MEPSAEPSVFPMFSYTFSTPPAHTLCTYYIIINSTAYRNRRTSGGPGPSRILIGGLGASIGRVLCGHLWAFALMWPVRKRKTWWFQQHSGAGEPTPAELEAARKLWEDNGGDTLLDSSTTVPRRFRTVPQTVPGRLHVGKLHICHICARMRASACKCAPKTRQTGRFRDGSIQFHAIKRNTQSQITNNKQTTNKQQTDNKQTTNKQQTNKQRTNKQTTNNEQTNNKQTNPA